MIDSVKLKQQHSVAVMVCIGITIVPMLLGQVGLVFARSGETAAASISPLLLALLGLVGLAPLALVPQIRRIGRDSFAAASQTDDGLATTMMIWSVTEYALWEIPSLIGFFGVVQGAPISFLFACIAVSAAGFIVSFPRWSRWRADAGLESSI